MSTMLSLFCYVLRDDPKKVFHVNVDSSQTISHLKNIIKAEKSNAFKDVAACALHLWKVSIAADDIFNNGIDGNNFEDTGSLRPTYKLSRVFSEPLLDDHVHVVIRPEGPSISNMYFHHDEFCRRVFRRLWGRRQHQTCIHERDGFKYLDLRPLGLQFGGHTRILIREEYIRLVSEAKEVHEKYINARSHLRSGGVVMTGQPGIGKTLFLQWLLLERLLDGKRTILRTMNDYAYFSANGFIRISEWALPSFPDIWLLADPLFGSGGPPTQTGLFTIFTTLPSEGLYRQWSKQNLAELFIMSPWTWEELNFVGSSFFDAGSVDLGKLETAFTLYGPTARYPLAYAGGVTKLADLEYAVNRAISSVYCSTLDLLANQHGPSDASSELLYMFGDDRGLPTFKIASAHILAKLYRSLLSRERVELVKWFRGFSCIPKAGTGAGWIWEAHCHSILPTLSSLAITSLDDKEKKTLRLVPSSRIDFKVLKDIPEKPSPGYYAPVTRNHTTFDAFSVTDSNLVVLMQFTVCADHPESKGVGLDALADVLDKNFRPFTDCSWLFIWVVPNGMEHLVTATHATKGHWKAWQKQSTMKQYVATLEF